MTKLKEVCFVSEWKGVPLPEEEGFHFSTVELAKKGKKQVFFAWQSPDWGMEDQHEYLFVLVAGSWHEVGGLGHAIGVYGDTDAVFYSKDDGQPEMLPLDTVLQPYLR